MLRYCTVAATLKASTQQEGYPDTVRTVPQRQPWLATSWLPPAHAQQLAQASKQGLHDRQRPASAVAAGTSMQPAGHSAGFSTAREVRNRTGRAGQSGAAKHGSQTNRSKDNPIRGWSERLARMHDLQERVHAKPIALRQRIKCEAASQVYKC